MPENNRNLDAQKTQIGSDEALQEAIRNVEQQEQLYSIALFDILGFSNYVESNGTNLVKELYSKLVDLIAKIESHSNEGSFHPASVVPVPTSPDWTNNQLVADANGYIHVCHFSDTFLIYVNYMMGRNPWWLRDSYYESYPLTIGEANTEYCPLFFEEHHIYISFLQVCMHFFCEAIKLGIPLRGCISTGMAVMNKHQSIYFGRPLVEAARGESAQNAIGVSFGKSFNNYHPVYNQYFIPYPKHAKENNSQTHYLSPMSLDWPRYWRNSTNFNNLSLVECINKMNLNPSFSNYYDNAVQFVQFSEANEKWSDMINREGLTDIIDYYKRVNDWIQSL